MRVGPRFPVRAGIVPGGACRRVTYGRACRNRAHDPRIGVTGASCDLRASELCPVQPTSAKSLPPSGPCPQPCSSLVVLYRVGALRERRQPVSCSRSHGAVGPLDETPTAPAAPACGFCETPTTPACPKRHKSGPCGATGVVLVSPDVGAPRAGVVAVSPGVGAPYAGVVAVSPGVGESRTDSAQRRWSHALGGRASAPARGRKPVAGNVRVAGEVGTDVPCPTPWPGAPAIDARIRQSTPNRMRLSARRPLVAAEFGARGIPARRAPQLYGEGAPRRISGRRAHTHTRLALPRPASPCHTADAPPPPPPPPRHRREARPHGHRTCATMEA